MKKWNTDPLSTVFLQPCSILLEFSWPCFNSLSGSGFEMVHTLQRIMFYISICLPGKRVQIKRNSFSGSLEGRVSSAFCLTELCSQPRHYRRFTHWLIVKFLEILNRFSFALACCFFVHHQFWQWPQTHMNLVENGKSETFIKVDWSKIFYLKPVQRPENRQCLPKRSKFSLTDISTPPWLKNYVMRTEQLVGVEMWKVKPRAILFIYPNVWLKVQCKDIFYENTLSEVNSWHHVCLQICLNNIIIFPARASPLAVTLTT